MKDTEVMIPCRLSYTFIWERRRNEDGSEGKYSAALLFDKSDKKTLSKINAAIEAVKTSPKGKQKLANSKGVIPSTIKLPLRDGDETDKPEFEGHWFINASSNDAVPVYNRHREKLSKEEDAAEIYSGVYANAKVNFYAFNFSGSKGIACGLQGIQKVKDGEHLAGGMATANDFEDLEDDDADEDFLG